MMTHPLVIPLNFKPQFVIRLVERLLIIFFHKD